MTLWTCDCCKCLLLLCGAMWVRGGTTVESTHFQGAEQKVTAVGFEPTPLRLAPGASALDHSAKLSHAINMWHLQGLWRSRPGVWVVLFGVLIGGGCLFDCNPMDNTYPPIWFKQNWGIGLLVQFSCLPLRK